jgi:hypothetical protein
VRPTFALLPLFAFACGPESGPEHLLIRTSRDPDFAAREASAREGVRYLSRVEPGLWWVSAVPGAEVEDARRPSAREKLDVREPSFAGRRPFVVVVQPDVAKPRDRFPDDANPLAYPIQGWFTAELGEREVQDLALDDAIRWIADAPDDGASRPTNDTVRARTGAEEIQGFAIDADGQPTYSGYSGRGVTAAIFDAGYVSSHFDLVSRLHNPGPGNDHATSVAGIVAGDGTVSELHGGTPFQWRGMAPEAELVSAVGAPYASASNMAAYLWDDSADLSTASLALSTDGEYDALSVALDAVVRGSAGKPFPSTIAATNNGLYPEYGVIMGYYGVLQNSKNALIVGAMLGNYDHRWRGSSMGPSWDGRLCPHVMAPADWLTWPPHGRPVAIDWIRFENDAGEVGYSLEFDDAAQADGWREVQNVPSFTVTGGELQFLSEVVGIVMSPDALAVPATYHWLHIRMKVDEDADPRSRGALYEWGTTPYCGGGGCAVWSAGAGASWQPVTAGGAWDEHRVDVSSWGSDIQWLRIRPYDGSDKGTYGPVFVEGDDAAYGEHGQTSMATPVVGGAQALVLQALAETTGRDLDAEPFLASTVRALFMATAVDLVHEEEWVVDGDIPDTGRPVTYGPGPDWATGFGRVDVAAAVHAIEEGRFTEDAVHEGDTRVYEMEVPAGTSRLSVTLAWDDPPADPRSDWDAPKLVHDLDLVVTDGGGFVALPWTLVPPPHEALPSVNGIGAIDADTELPDAEPGENHLDNVEKVEVASPPAGTLRIEVRAPAALPEGPWQTFSLVSSLAFGPPGTCEPSTERCNLLDDDCDGDADDGLENEVEACDGLDEDCDGTIDEGCPCLRPRPCADLATGCLGQQSCDDETFGECVIEPGCPPPPEEDAGPGDEDAGEPPPDAGEPPADRPDDGGCGCRAPAGRASGSVAALVALAALVPRRRRAP